MGAAYRGRHACDAARGRCVEARPRRSRTNCRHSNRTCHDGDAHDAIPCQTSRGALHNRVRTSIQVLSMLENLQVDAGLTYVDNEPLGRVSTIPLYHEEYRLLTSSSGELGDRDQVTWAEVGKVPLRLLTPDMQKRRIMDGLLRSAGTEPSPTLESNSMIVLFAHVRTGKWASIMPAKLAETLGLTESVRSIPIVEPAATHAIGLVVPDREPTTPLIKALVAEARQLAILFDRPSPAAR